MESEKCKIGIGMQRRRKDAEKAKENFYFDYVNGAFLESL